MFHLSWHKIGCVISLFLDDDSNSNLYHSSWAMTNGQLFSFFSGGEGFVIACMHPGAGTKYKILGHYYDDV